MKKLLILAAMFSSVSFAQVEGYESIPYAGEETSTYGSICVSGHVFAYIKTYTNRGNTISLQQVFKDGQFYSSLNDPIKCESK